VKIVFNFLFLFCAAAVQVYASEPQRVITLLPSLGEVVYEVLENKTALVAVSNYTDFPPELKKVQTIGAYHHVNVEKIVSLKPDFVFVSRDGNNIDQIKQLEDHKIRICYLNLNSLNDIEQSYRIVGEALGQKKKGNQLAQQFREKNK
jgi:vitamin B12 transport system substrate-binding protein